MPKSQNSDNPRSFCGCLVCWDHLEEFRLSLRANKSADALTARRAAEATSSTAPSLASLRGSPFTREPESPARLVQELLSLRCLRFKLLQTLQPSFLGQEISMRRVQHIEQIKRNISKGQRHSQGRINFVGATIREIIGILVLLPGAPRKPADFISISQG